MTKLSAHFTLEELTLSQEALRKGLDNTPSPAITQNLTTVAQGLEKVRAVLDDHPISISSGYRSPAVNVAVGGSLKSAHCQGFAADFTCDGFGTPLEICRAIMKSDIAYDQLIFEGSWVHLSFAPTMRQENLKANFKFGKATYSTLI